MKIKQVFSKANKNQFGHIAISATDENSRDLEWFLQRFPMQVEHPKILTERARSFDAEAARTHAILSGDYETPDTEMALPPREYQLQAATLAHNVKGMLLADELGLGKTISALTLLSMKGTLPAVVVCPTHLPIQWEKEIKRFLPDLKTHVIKKTKIYDTGTPDVFIINYHKLSHWAEHLANYATTVVYDEVQELRRDRTNYGLTNKYAAASHISEMTEYRMGLSATPIYNYGGEFYNVIQCLAPGVLGEREEFLREWCSGYYDEKKARIKDPKAFGTWLRESGRMLLRTKKDVGRELPSLSKVVQEVEADLNHLKKIESAASELANFIVNSEGAKGFDMMQASQEFSNKLRQATGIAKAPFVAEFVNMLIESTEEKIVMFGWHREVYNLWAGRLKKWQPAWYTGTESVSKKTKEIERFINDPACKVLMMSLRSGAGVDGLQHVASRCVIGELDWSWGAVEQCIGRVHRDGQENPVFAYYPISNEGCDPIMIDVLGVKRQQLDGVRDPKGTAVIKNTVDPDHVKKLAQAYLRRKAS